MSAIVAPAIVRTHSPSEELVDRLRRGDADALGELYDLHAPALLGFARRLVGDADMAKDLVQEVFVAVPSAIQRFQGGSSVRTFLTAIAINHARHHVRSAARRRAAMSRLSREPEGPSTSPDERRARVQLAEALTNALDTLPLEQRVAFVLCEVEERTSREVAEIVDVPEATVRTRLFHAKKKLRDELAKRGLR